jgi:tripartite-type tricarboxylate transporter receptor subunit TctC
MPGWGGLLATAGTPKEVVAKLNAEVQLAVQRPELRQRLIAAGMEPPSPLDPDGFRKFIEADIARWTQFVDAVGVEKLKGDVPPQ